MSAAVVHHQQNRCMRRFHDAGAVSPETAGTLDQVGVRDSLVFRYLRSRGVVVDAGGQRFYLDPDAERKFRQRRFVFTASVLGVGLIVLLALMVAAMLRAAETPSAEDAVPPIHVVKTWQDLLDQPAISVGTGTAHLGIEAESAPCAGGVLLYCLTEGYSLPRVWNERNRIGPFLVEVRHETDEAGSVVVEVGKMARADPPDIGRSTALFRKSIPLDRPGRYHVRVRSPEGALLAATEINATRQACHPWMPLEPGEHKEEDRVSFDAVAHVRNRDKGIAIPRFDGMEPMLFHSDGPDSKVRRFPGEHLPTLVPEDAGAVLTVMNSGTGLVVESKADIILARPDWHFLARWWVNDKPYIPKQLSGFSDENGQVIIGKRLLLHLDFDPRRFAAAPGDTIDLQLLYCKNGWELVQPGSVLLHASLDAKGPELLLSNRTRIVPAKDTNHPAR